ncbi:hypothetical protein [Flavobacterium sp.]|uniref:hypothetical protein n=1 Tax=Flavobacterium sp. TaxID=239 RepID=UPI003D6A09A8
MSRIRKEEYTSLGDFVRESFVRDQEIIMVRYPKLNAAFLADFTAKLEEVKILESGLVLTEEQKNTTASLYTEAAELNKELNFLKSYINNAGLDIEIIISLKNDLVKSNIEGAVLKLESLKQFVSANLAALVAEGMIPTFVSTLNEHKISLSEKNAAQNVFMNNRKTLTESNITQYNALYGYISKVVNAGRLIFEDTVKKDEYSIRRAVSRMRSARQPEKEKTA